MKHAAIILLILIAFSTCCAQQKVKELSSEANTEISPADSNPPATPRTLSEEKLERKKDIEKRMLKGEYLHDGAIDLQGIGDLDSVPALLMVLKEYPPSKNGGMICTAAHAVDALKTITGADPGITFEAWNKWWMKNQPATTH
jgi:hypothetical protein